MNNLKLHSTLFSILFYSLILISNYVILNKINLILVISLITFFTSAFFKYNWIFFQKKSDYFYSLICINLINSLIIGLLNNFKLALISLVINIILGIGLYMFYRLFFIHNQLKTLIISNNQEITLKIKKYADLFNVEQTVSYEEFINEFQVLENLKQMRLNYGISNNQLFQHVLVDQLNTEQISNILNYCYLANIDVTIIPTMNDILYQAKHTYYLSDRPFYYYQYRDNYIFNIIRRTSDIFCSGLGLIITSPIMLITAILIKLEDFKSPIFYTQQRIGINGKKFKIYKFRSMVNDAEKHGIQLSTKNDSRVTKIGNFIRKTRIDELPQLINILKGDMSLVGPRPERDELIQEYLKNYPNFNYRLKTKPGLSGLAQIEGKYNTNPDDKASFDVVYTNHKNYLLDLNLIIRTIKVLFMKESTEGLDSKDQFHKDKNST